MKEKESVRKQEEQKEVRNGKCQEGREDELLHERKMERQEERFKSRGEDHTRKRRRGER